MADKVKKASQKVHGQDNGGYSVDIHYVNNDSSDNISWSSVVNAPVAGPSEKYDHPAPAMLAVDCENVSRAHLPMVSNRVSDDSVVLEMTVTSEFTLVGYADEDDHIPDDETMQQYYVDSPEPSSPPGVGRKRERVSPASAPRNRKAERRGSKRGKKDLSSARSRKPRRRRGWKSVAVDGDGSDSDENAKVDVKQEQTHECPECDRSFPTGGGLKMHMMVHADSGSFVCFVCGSRFESLKSLKAHASSHTSESQNVCDDCGRWYKDQQVLERHSERHLMSDGKIVDCGMCGEEYETDADLAEHVLGHVAEMKWNACLVCGRHLAPMSSMEKHLRTHTGEKAAECPVCARQFAEAYNLKSHLRIHTGERPYVCPRCERRFTSVSTLKNHVLTHSEEKQYACTYCEKRFVPRVYYCVY